VSHLLEQGFPRGSIRHEIPMDTSSSGGRADIVLLAQERIIGLELKSGKDTLDRCDTQAHTYSMAFDSKILVADRRHLTRDNINFKAPTGWVNFICYSAAEGLTLDYGGACQLLIRASQFPSRSTSAFRMASLLWQVEATNAAAKSSLHCSTRTKAIRSLAEHVPLHALRKLVLAELRERPLNKWEIAFWTRFDGEPTPPCTDTR
jgi:hypothetical protein